MEDEFLVFVRTPGVEHELHVEREARRLLLTLSISMYDSNQKPMRRAREGKQMDQIWMHFSKAA